MAVKYQNSGISNTLNNIDSQQVVTQAKAKLKDDLQAGRVSINEAATLVNHLKAIENNAVGFNGISSQQQIKIPTLDTMSTSSVVPSVSASQMNSLAKAYQKATKQTTTGSKTKKSSDTSSASTSEEELEESTSIDDILGNKLNGNSSKKETRDTEKEKKTSLVGKAVNAVKSGVGAVASLFKGKVDDSVDPDGDLVTKAKLQKIPSASDEEVTNENAKAYLQQKRLQEQAKRREERKKNKAKVDEINSAELEAISGGTSSVQPVAEKLSKKYDEFKTNQVAAAAVRSAKDKGYALTDEEEQQIGANAIAKKNESDKKQALINDVNSKKGETWMKTRAQEIDDMSSENLARVRNLMNAIEARDTAEKDNISLGGVHTNEEIAAANNAIKMNSNILAKAGYNVDDIVRYQTMMQNAKDTQTAKQIVSDMASQGSAAGAGSTLLSSVENLVASPVAALDILGQKADRLITGSDAPIDVNTINQRGVNEVNAIRSTVAGNVENSVYDATGNEDLAKLASFSYQLVPSMIDSTSSMLLTGGASNPLTGAMTSAILGSSAGVQSYKDAKERGASDNQALSFGLVAGVAEGFFEKYSVESVLDTISESTAKQAGTKFAENVLKQAGIEGSEEVATEIADRVSDYIINGNYSEFKQTYDNAFAEAIKNGATAEEAKKEACTAAATDVANNVALAGIGGAISGGAMGGGASILNSVLNNNVTEDVNTDNNLVNDTITESATEEIPAIDMTQNAADNNVEVIDNGIQNGEGSNPVSGEMELTGQEANEDVSAGRTFLPDNRGAVQRELSTNEYVVDENTRSVLTEAGVSDFGFKVANNNAALFSQALDTAIRNNPNGASVDSHTAEQMQEIIDNGGTCFLNEDGTAGGAVEADGNLTAVFKDSTLNHMPNGGVAIAITARTKGAVKGDCFGRTLVNIYAQAGFEPVGRMKYGRNYNTLMDEYVDRMLASGKITDEPDVYVLRIKPGSTVESVAADYKNDDCKLWEQEELDALPEYDNYEEMLAARDAMLEQGVPTVEEQVQESVPSISDNAIGATHRGSTAGITQAQALANQNTPTQTNSIDSIDEARLNGLNQELHGKQDITHEKVTHAQLKHNAEVEMQNESVYDVIDRLAGYETWDNYDTVLALTVQDEIDKMLNDSETGSDESAELGKIKDKLYRLSAQKGTEQGQALNARQAFYPLKRRAVEEATRMLTKLSDEKVSSNPKKSEAIKNKVTDAVDKAKTKANEAISTLLTDDGEGIARKLADKIEKEMNSGHLDQRTEKQILVNELVNQLFEVAKENGLNEDLANRDSTQLKEHGDGIKRKLSAQDKLSLAVNFQDAYETVWNKAKGVLALRYGMSEEVLNRYENYFRSLVESNNFYSDKLVAKAIKEYLSDSNSSIRELADKSAFGDKSAIDKLVNGIIDAVNPPESARTALERNIRLSINTDVAFSKAIGNAGKRALKNYLSESQISASDVANSNAFGSNSGIDTIVNGMLDERGVTGDARTDMENQIRREIDNYDSINKAKENANSRVLKGAADYIGVNFSEIVRASKGNKEIALAAIKNALKTKYGINTLDAGFMAETLSQTYYEALAKEADRQVKNMLKPKTPTQLTAHDTLIDTIRMGVYDGNTDVQDYVSAQYGIGALTPEQTSRIEQLADEAESLPENSAERLAKEEQIRAVIAENVNSSLSDKINAWRYMAMLGNVRTNLKNIGGNISMGVNTAAKNEVLTIAESIASVLYNNEKKGRKLNRTASSLLVPSKANRTLISACYKDAPINAWRQLTGSSKRFTSAEGAGLPGKIYSNKILELARNMSNFALDEADKKGTLGALKGALPEALYKRVESTVNKLGDEGIVGVAGLQNNYARALASYLKANGKNESVFESTESSDVELLNKAREHAVNEALEATYHAESKLADEISAIKRKFLKGNAGRKLFGVAAEGVLPFVKTPINVLKEGVRYSPAGLAETTALAFKACNGQTDVNAVLNALSKNVTGTSLFIVGAMLYNAGFLTANFDDDEKKQAKSTGEQEYAIRIPDDEGGYYTYTIDFATSAALPLAIGAIYAKMNEQEGEFSLNNLWSSVSSLADPIMEMSFMQGVNNTLESIANSDNRAISIIGAAATNYATQVVPTVSGQIARGIDSNRRSTYSDKTGLEGELAYTLNKTANKIPFLSMDSEEYVDPWGNTQEDGGLAYNLLSPGYLSHVKNDSVNEEINDVYESTGSASVLPSLADKKLTLRVGDTDEFAQRKLTPEEYTEYAKELGKTKREAVEALFDSNFYQELTDEQKKDAISDFYSYAKSIAADSVFGDEYNLDSSNNKKYAEAYNQGGVDALVSLYQSKQAIKQLGTDTMTMDMTSLDKKYAAYFGNDNDREDQLTAYFTQYRTSSKPYDVSAAKMWNKGDSAGAIGLIKLAAEADGSYVNNKGERSAKDGSISQSEAKAITDKKYGEGTAKAIMYWCYLTGLSESKYRSNYLK